MTLAPFIGVIVYRAAWAHLDHRPHFELQLPFATREAAEIGVKAAWRAMSGTSSERVLVVETAFVIETGAAS